MGNADSTSKILTPNQQVNAILTSSGYPMIKRRADKMGIEVTVQGDGSIQLQNPKNLVKGNRNVRGPITEEDVEEVMQKVTETLDELAKECGFIHFGYQ